MNLTIDNGNTALKAGVFDQGTLVFSDSCLPDEVHAWLEKLKKYPITSAILSSVAPVPELVTDYLSTISFKIVLSDSTLLPFTNAYQTPKTLGTDRLANIAGANELFAKKNVLVIDVGTCLKMDWIDTNSVYRGGSIAPGLKMRYRSLNEFTDRLPLLEPIEHTELTGINTEGSIHSGVLNGMTGEINASIESYQHQLNDLQCILTGGDSRFFLNTLKTRIFAAPALTLLGLDSILRFNQ
ncbi:type III pantothenate kinase [soil metagenome]